MLEILKAVLYGLISGFSEILPVSSRGHQAVLMQLFGMSHRDPVLDLLVHLGTLASVVFCCRTELIQLVDSFSISGRRRVSKELGYENRLIKTAMIPLIIGLFFYGSGTKYESKPLLIALFMLINGVILFIPDHIRQSNKNAGQMGLLDSLLIGFSSVVCCFPGVSRMSAGLGFSQIRGADKQHAFKWLLILTVPSLLFMIILDLIGLFTLGLTALSVWLFIGYILSVAAAFAGGYIAIMLMRFLMVNSGFSGFAYYSLGAAAFTFILYLIAF